MSLNKQIRFGKTRIPYSVIKSKRRKTSQIIVDNDYVIIRTPISKSTKDIQNIMQSKARWVYKKQLELKSRSVKKQKRKIHSKKFLKRRISYFSKKLKLYPKNVNIKKLKSRWGSLTKNGILNLNVNLLKAPKAVIDYIIIHELCHFIINDHSFRYWRLVRKYMPDYEEKIRWLNKNGKNLLCKNK